MKTQYGDFFSKDKLKNRFKTLKKTYADLKAMLDLSGFGWDDARKMVTAEPQVWKEYVAVSQFIGLIFNSSCLCGER